LTAAIPLLSLVRRSADSHRRIGRRSLNPPIIPGPHPGDDHERSNSMREKTAILLAALFILVAPTASAQDPRGCQMSRDTGAMRRMDHAMMARMDTVDARLDSLAKLMDRATGTRKVNAMAEILNTMVAHHLGMRREMHQGMMKRDGGGGMMQRMGQGKPDCVMMQGGRPDTVPPGPHRHRR
jgi:hypothetical protein